MNKKVVSTPLPQMSFSEKVKGHLRDMYISLRTPQEIKQPGQEDILKVTEAILNLLWNEQNGPEVIIFVKYETDHPDYRIPFTRSVWKGLLQRVALGIAPVADSPKNSVGSVTYVMRQNPQPICTENQEEIIAFLKKSFPLEGWRKYLIENSIGENRFYKSISMHIRSFMVFPIIYNGQLIGHISISGSNPLTEGYKRYVQSQYIEAIQNSFGDKHLGSMISNGKSNHTGLELLSSFYQSDDALMTLNPDGSVQMSNLVAQKMFNIQSGQMRHLPSEHANQLIRILVRMSWLKYVLKKETIKIKKEISFTTALGKPINAEVKAELALGMNGQTLGINLSVRDITALKTAERENAELLKTVQAQYLKLEEIQKKIQVELERAMGSQRSMLEPIPVFPNITIQGVNIPANDTVSSDGIHLYQDKASGLLSILMIDANGHGAAGALDEIHIHKIFDELYQEHLKNPGQLMDELNRGALKIMKDPFHAVFVGSLNPKTGKLLYCFAGAPRGVLIRSNKLIFLDQGAGLFLGNRFDESYPTGETHLKNGDRLFFYSDGLFEYFEKEDNPVETQSFKNILLSLDKNTGARKNIAQLLAELKRITPAPKSPDDLSILMFDFRAPITECFLIASPNEWADWVKNIELKLEEYNFDEKTISIIKNALTAQNGLIIQGRYKVACNAFTLELPLEKGIENFFNHPDWEKTTTPTHVVFTLEPTPAEMIYEFPKPLHAPSP